MTTHPHPHATATARPGRRLGGWMLLPLLAMLASTASVSPAGAAADPRITVRTTQQGVTLKLNLPAGRWHAGDRVEGFVRVTNTNDRTAWFLDTDCRDIGVEVRVPTNPDQGHDWTGDRAAFKRMALSTQMDVGPLVGRFTVQGVAGDCAEPVARSLTAGESRGYHVSMRARHVGLGVSSLDVSAMFQFEGFRRSEAQWQDLMPPPITASLRVRLEQRPATILSPVRAIDLGLAKGWVRDDIVASDRSGWIRADMELSYRANRLWQWRVDLWEDGNDAQHQARIAASFIVNARTGAVTSD